ncbi:putative defense protein 3 isoform X2 [Ptychodera flava]|uniref:putative defense protein 3 isoform X2 n=1 Tax=Ptychodera flava TaxID=63121 RepID=UPI00396A6B69
MHPRRYISALLGILIFSLLQVSVTGYGSGAPDSACTTMTPGHVNGQTGVALSPQDGSSNIYTLSASSDSYTPGGTVSVTISGSPFSGLLLQARRPGQTTPIGSFSSVPGNTKLKTCSSTDDSVTHSNTNTKPAGTAFIWNAPSNGVGDIEFVATVAKNHDLYWVNIKSSVLTEATELTTPAPSSDVPPRPVDSNTTPGAVGDGKRLKQTLTGVMAAVMTVALLTV